MGAELKALSRQLDDAKDQIWGLREEKERLQSELTEVMFERGTLEKHIDKLIDEIQRLKNINMMGGVRGKTDIGHDDQLLVDAFEAFASTTGRCRSVHQSPTATCARIGQESTET